MTNKFTLILAFLSSLAILSACGSSSKMKNRHYQQWSYVSETKEAENSEKTIVYIEPNTSLETEILNESISIYAIAPNESNPDNLKNRLGNPSSSTKGEVNSKNKKVLNEDFSLSELKFNKKLKSSLYPASLPATSDLSLLWIVIIILLILWALGLISGNFGGLIHLLLVIALILLILWLLKII